MSKKTLLLILGLFSILTFWGMFNNPHHLILIFIIILSLILNNRFKNGRGRFFLWLSIFAIIYLVFSNPFFFVGLILLVVYITNNHPELSELFQTVFSEKSKKTGKSDFIIVDFNESDQIRPECGLVLKILDEHCRLRWLQVAQVDWCCDVRSVA